jgi:multidrug efflux pump subunit AcrB
MALLLTGRNLDMAALIGMLMLAGIVTKNSILLVEFAVMAQAGGMARGPAVLDACHKRARPVLMTTLAMGAGMLPIAAGFGPNPGFRSTTAIAVECGLLASTFLSLLVIPVLYTVLDVVARRCRRWMPAGTLPSSDVR